MKPRNEVAQEPDPRLKAPVTLTPEQIEQVAGGTALDLSKASRLELPPLIYGVLPAD
jgi:hypothetical protein